MTAPTPPITDRAILLCALLVLAQASQICAQSAENVAVIVNDASPASQKIAEHYARVRAVPPSNVLHITTTTDETIPRDAYVSTIERPVGDAIKRAGLQDRLLYLVITKGVPLRIAGTTGLKGNQASVDSELTLLYRRLTGQTAPTAGVVDNPYYLGTRDISEARPFSHRDHDIYLVTRLDGFTADDVIALVDRAQSPSRSGRVVLDQRADPSARTGDDWIDRAAQRLTAQGHGERVVLEKTPKPARDIEGVIAYYSWGSADPETRVRSAGMAFVPGAIAANLASFDARTFREPPADWRPSASHDKSDWFEGSADTLVGDFVRNGITGVAGQVGEGFVLGAVRPEILFPAYLAGFNLVESFYLATPTLSWQTVIIGDPLCAPFDGKRLTRHDLEDAVDPRTLLAALFSARSVASIAAANRDVPETSILPTVRAMTLLARDDKAGAVPALTEALAQAPKLPGWRLFLSSLLEQAGDYDAAIETYRDILLLQPTNVVAMNNLAYALAVHRGAPAEALPIAKRAVALAPQAGTIVETLAWTEHLLGNHETAAKLVENAVRLDSRTAEIRLHAAIIYAEAGWRERAASELKEALRLDPALESREDVRKLRGRLTP